MSTLEGRRVTPLAFALRLTLLSALNGCADFPDIDELDQVWNRLEPGGETACALGDEYAFYVHPAERDLVLVFFDGGGGCWSRDTCASDESAQYTSRVERDRRPEVRQGIFDLNDPRNPILKFSMIMVPYCTADQHLGTRVHAYEGSEGGEPLVIRHLGQVNAMAVIEWITANFEHPHSIIVAGLSAGGVAAPFYADVLARRYPEARVVGISDGVGALGIGTMPGLDPTPWAVPGAFADEPGWSELDLPDFGIEEFFRTAAAPPGEPELFQLDFANDANQTRRLEQAGTNTPNVLELLDRNQAYIRKHDADFRSFTLGGDWHGILTNPAFYVVHENERRAVDWVDDIVRGEPLADVRCSECRRPHLLFAQSDLQLLDRALVLLEQESAWDANQPPGSSCSRTAHRRSLWCALVEATRQLELGNPASQAGTLEVVILATLRLGGGEPRRPLTRYNNADGRKFDEVRSLLQKARANIAGALASEP